MGASPLFFDSLLSKLIEPSVLNEIIKTLAGSAQIAASAVIKLAYQFCGEAFVCFAAKDDRSKYLDHAVGDFWMMFHRACSLLSRPATLRKSKAMCLPLESMASG